MLVLFMLSLNLLAKSYVAAQYKECCITLKTSKNFVFPCTIVVDLSQQSVVCNQYKGSKCYARGNINFNAPCKDQFTDVLADESCGFGTPQITHAEKDGPCPKSATT